MKKPTIAKSAKKNTKNQTTRRNAGTKKNPELLKVPECVKAVPLKNEEPEPAKLPVPSDEHPLHPGDALKAYLKETGVTIRELAKRIGGSRSSISGIVNHRISVTPEMALRLSAACNIPVEVWCFCQQNYVIWKLRHNKTFMEEVKKIASRRECR